jgi:hypothetical protein
MLGSTEFSRTYYDNDPMLQLLQAVADSRNLLLPWDSDGSVQMVDESELWELFTRMRRVLWNVPHAKGSIDYTRIVQEFPPLGSCSQGDGSYSTTHDVRISRELRMQVMAVKNEFFEEARKQNEQSVQNKEATVTVRRFAEPIILERYFEEPLEARHQPRILQSRLPTPHVQAGTSAILQRDSRMTCGYTVNPIGLYLP